MRKYETMYITDREKERIEAINSRIKEVVEKNQGTFIKGEDWGTRRLAYPIKKVRRGTLVRLVYEILPSRVSEVDRLLKFQDGVLRFRTMVLEGEGPSHPYEPPEVFREVSDLELSGEAEVLEQVKEEEGATAKNKNQSKFSEGEESYK